MKNSTVPTLLVILCIVCSFFYACTFPSYQYKGSGRRSWPSTTTTTASRPRTPHDITTRRSVASYLQQFPDEKAVYDFVDERLIDQFDVDAEEPYLHIVTQRIVVLDSQLHRGTEHFSLRLAPNEECQYCSIVVQDPDRTQHDYRLSDAVTTRNTDDNSETLDFTVSALNRGTLVEVSYQSEIHDQFDAHPLMVNRDLYCDSLSLIIRVERARHLRWKRGSDGKEHRMKPVQEESWAQQQRYVYQATQVKAVADLPFSERLLSAADYFQFRYDEPELTWTQPRLDLFHDYFSQRIPQQSDITSAALGSQTTLLTRYCRNADECVDSVLQWVQSNIRVDKSGALSTNESFEQVLQDKYGSASMIVGLTQAMLRIAGVSTDFVLLRGDEYGIFDSRFIRRDEFSTIALRYINKSATEEYIFPANPSIPRHEFPNWLDNTALIVNENPDSTRFYRLQTSDAQLDERECKITMTIAENHSAELELQFKCRGQFAGYLRDELRESSRFTEREIRKTLLDALPISWDLSMEEQNAMAYDIKNQLSSWLPLEVHMHFRISNCFAATGSGASTIALNELLSFDPVRDSTLSNTSHHAGVYLPSNSVFHTTLQVRYPAAWVCTLDSSKRNERNELGSLAFTISRGKNELSFDKEIRLNKGHYPALMRPALIRLLGSESALNKVDLILSPRR